MFAALHLLATESDPNSTLDLVLGLAVPAVIVAWALGSVRTFRKAGVPGWAGIVPGLHLKYMAELTGVETWSMIIFWPLRARARYELALRFGQSRAFGWGIALLPFVFYPILGFGPATYGDQNLISSR